MAGPKVIAACETLGVELDGLTAESIGAAFRAASKDCHPDSQSPDELRWVEISDAKTILETWLSLNRATTAKGNCRACAGMGYTQSRNGFALGPRKMCVLCSGSGNLRTGERD